MKPMRLEMTNFGPYRQEIIDFSVLDEQNLFLISGRTGAGKSSIFDAMLYALYDETSSDRSVQELRSTFASIKDPRTKVVFYFEHHNQLYRVERELNLMPKKGIDRGKGIGTKEASLSVVDGLGGLELSKLAAKTKDVTAAVIDLLGLTAGQFKQIILLPQYQFSQFLKSSTKDKIPILRQIFGTQVFADFETELAQRWAQAKQEQEDFQTSFETYFSNQVWSEEEQAAFKDQAQAEKVKLAQTFLKDHEEKLRSLSNLEAQAQKKAQVADQAHQEGLSLAEKFQNQANLQKRYQEEVLKQESEVASKQKHIAQLEFAASLADLVKNLDAKTTAVQQGQKSLEDLEKKLEAQRSSLSPLQETLTALEAEKPQQEAAYASLTDLTLALNQAKQLADKEAQKGNLDARLADLAEQQTELGAKAEDLKTQQAELDSQAVSQAQLDELETLTAWTQGLVADNLDKRLGQLEVSQQKLAEAEQDLEKVDQEIQTWSDQLEGYRLELEHKKQDRRQLMIAQLQAELAPGQACPVCGALEHPNLTAGEFDSARLRELLEAIEQLEKNYSQRQEDLQATQMKKEHLQASHQAETARKAELQVELDRAYQELQDKLSPLLVNLTWPASYQREQGQKTLRELKKQLKQLESLQSAQNLQRQTLAKEEQELAQSRQDLDQQSSRLEGQRLALDKELTQLKNDQPNLEAPSVYETRIATIKQAYEHFQAQLSASQKQVLEAKERLSSLSGQLQSQQAHLQADQEKQEHLAEQLGQALLAEGGLTQRPDQLEAWIKEEEAGQLAQAQQWLARYEQNKDNLEAELNQLSQVLEDQQEPNLQDLAELKTQADQAAKAAARDLAVHQNDYEQMRHLVASLEQQAQKNAQQQESFSQLTQLRNIISGQVSGQKRLKLETYVIQTYLEEILTYANNNYIGLLSNQQFEFLMAEDSSGNGQTGLDINIFDRANNKELPASSLSGGETFIASLAIALSLSEVVQNASNGALVETLFIDEGFGSLDEETLDKAIAVLEQISQNRLVGVISHVKEMKESIQQQLLIEKGPDGSSRIKVIAN